MTYDLETLTKAFLEHIKYHHEGVIYATEGEIPVGTLRVAIPTVKENKRFAVCGSDGKTISCPEDVMLAFTQIAAERDSARAALDQAAAGANKVIDQLKAELAAMTERGIERHAWHLGNAAELVAERDAARAEVDALRARKVTLPGRVYSYGLIGNTDRQNSWNRAIDACADAIRAAGVEVEG